MGATMVACEVDWLRKLPNDMGLSMQESIVIYCDKISSIMLVNNLVYHARTKHIEVHYHFVREKVLMGDVDLVYVNTEEQVIDIFRKALGIEKLRRFRGLLGVVELDLSLRGEC